MHTEQRLIVILTLLTVILLTVFGLVVLFALWQYRLIVSIILFCLAVLLLLLVIGIVVNEQVLRHKRVKFRDELPLDSRGRPLYLPQEMQVYHDSRYE